MLDVVALKDVDMCECAGYNRFDTPPLAVARARMYCAQPSAIYVQCFMRLYYISVILPSVNHAQATSLNLAEVSKIFVSLVGYCETC